LAGLYNKYTVCESLVVRYGRAQDESNDRRYFPKAGDYFILKLNSSDSAAKVALQAYCDEIKEDNTVLHEDLLKKVRLPALKFTLKVINQTPRTDESQNRRLSKYQ